MTRNQIDKMYDIDRDRGYMCPYEEYYRTAHYDYCEDRIEFICTNPDLNTYNRIIDDWNDLCGRCPYWNN